MKPMKKDEVSTNSVLIVTLVTIFTGLSILIARFYSQIEEGAYSRDKSTLISTFMYL